EGGQREGAAHEKTGDRREENPAGAAVNASGGGRDQTSGQSMQGDERSGFRIEPFCLSDLGREASFGLLPHERRPSRHPLGGHVATVARGYDISVIRAGEGGRPLRSRSATVSASRMA